MSNRTKPPALELNGVALSDTQLARAIQGIKEATGAEARFDAFSSSRSTAPAFRSYLSPGDATADLSDRIQQQPLVRGATQAQQSDADAISSAWIAIESTSEIKDVEQTISNFEQSSDLILKGLAAVQQLHPFIGSQCFHCVCGTIFSCDVQLLYWHSRLPFNSR